MTEERLPSSLKGRLADVYVPALVRGELEALSRRLGNRATIDDPLFGRASSLASLDPLIGKVSSWFTDRKSTYQHTYSTTGIDRDAAEGLLSISENGTARALPIVVVAERRRLREIELRIYHAGDGVRKRPPMIAGASTPPVPSLVQTAIDAMRLNALEGVLATFEESARVIDSHGKAHDREGGALANWLSEAALDLYVNGLADDGRCCCIEANLTRAGESTPAVLAFERGDSGLIHELRVY